ncbi:hypothetical protein [Thiolapillus sp.]
MLTKIVFTLAVIGIVIFLTRFRGRPARRPSPVARQEHRSPWTKGLVLAVVSIMTAGSALGLWLYWRDAHQVMQIWVVDSRSGHRSEYQAYRGSLDGRGFETVDGRRVHLAETERMEVEEK